MIKYHFITLLCCSSLMAAAQKKISGKILDEKAQQIPFASITVLRHADSMKLHSLMSDTAGNFALSNMKEGKYLVKISYLGYEDYYSPVVELTEIRKHHHFGDIRLKTDSRLLNTVTISGQKPLIEQTMDRTVMNIEKSILAEGNTALELLSKAPGLTVTEGGEVSLKGRSGTTVMINGKPTYLSGDQLANLLKGTNSSSISRIEIMSNPTAQFDAAGSGGIVNIVMKKNTMTGFNGSISGNIGRGRDIRNGGGISLNYRSNVLNVYGSYNSNNQNLESGSKAERHFFDSSNGSAPLLLQSIQQENKEFAKLRSHNFRFGTDLNINDKNTIGFLINGAIGKYPTSQVSSSMMNNPDGSFRWNALTQTEGDEHWRDLLYNLNYIHKFNKEGHELKADVDYVYHFSRMNQLLDTRYVEASSSPVRPSASRRGDIPSNNDIYAAKLDYTLPLSKTSKLEAGWKGSYVRTENNLRYDTLQTAQYVYDVSTSNHFIYKEHIQAAYVNFNTRLGSYGIQAGLRTECTDTKGHQLSTDSLFKRDYAGLFPSLFLSRDIGENQNMKAGYSRRIKRPSYWDLNPFRVYDDPFAFYEGNPYLKPSIVNAFELSYGYQSRYFATLSYNHAGDVIEDQIGRLGDGNVTFERPENLGSFSNYGLSITASTKFFKWWSGNQFLNIYHNRYRISSSTGTVNNNGNTLSLNSQNTFELGKGWKAELSAFYISGEATGITNIKPYSIISSGMQKEVLKGKGSIKLMLNDIFEGYRVRREMSFENVIFRNRRNADSRYGLLSFTYRFGGSTAGNSNERGTSSEELKGRL